jgi:hypothetical protein
MGNILARRDDNYQLKMGRDPTKIMAWGMG